MGTHEDTSEKKGDQGAEVSATLPVKPVATEEVRRLTLKRSSVSLKSRGCKRLFMEPAMEGGAVGTFGITHGIFNHACASSRWITN